MTSRRNSGHANGKILAHRAESGQILQMEYTVYILACADGTLYTGIARDLERRVAEHNGVSPKGARYTASRRPVRIVYCAPFASRSEALREEIRINRLSRAQKEQLIAVAAALSLPAVS